MTEPKIGWIQCWQNDLRIFWNPTKNRQEKWRRSLRGDEEWFLWDALPGRAWRESFMGGPDFRVATFGLGLDHDWSTNGNTAPAVGNFTPANEVGGGLKLVTDATGDRWLAIHSGGNYPVTVNVSPHLYILAQVETVTAIRKLIGLVGVSTLETGNAAAWTTPDDGIWLEHDTSVDDNLRFVTRSGGLQTSTTIGVLTLGHHSVVFQMNDAGDEVKLIYDGTVEATHTTHLPTVQLKPIFMVGTRENVAKDLVIRDFLLLYDRLAY